MLKNVTKLISFSIIISIIIFFTYLNIPHKSQKLIYFPKNKDSLNIFLLTQDISINSFDIYFLKFFDIKSGWSRVKWRINKIDIIKLAKSNKNEKLRVMVAYGGESIDSFLKQIAKQANLNFDKLKLIYQKKAKFEDASIVARKYYIPYKVDEESVINYILAKSLYEYKKVAKKYNVKINSKEFKNKLIIASIIQKETHIYQEMPLIASVIYNRLKNNLKLQMDATLNYGKYSHRVVTPYIIRHDNSKFNTYKFKGLPSSPLGIITLDALKAAFNPIKSNYLYFVQSGNRHIFSKDYKKHKKRVAIYKKNLRIKRLIKKEFKRVSQISFKPIIYKLSLPIKLK